MRSKDIITLNDPTSLAAESYKMFRSNLHYMNVDADKQVIMFTSSLAGEGKTTSISNVAVSFAQDGNRTLLIDCDLRRARLHLAFNIPQIPGLTNVLTSDCSLDEAVINIEEEQLLDILPGGPLPPAPAELLGSKALELIIKEARGKYDKILIDAPPILSVTDGVVLNRIVDGVVLVVASEDTHKDVIGKTIALLKKIDANLLGVLISKMDFKRNGHYGYYNYGYSYGQEKPSKNPFKRKNKTRQDVTYEDVGTK